MVFEKAKKALGYREIEYDGETFRVVTQVGDMLNLQKTIAECKNTNNNFGIYKAVLDFAIKVFMNANPEEDKEEITQLFEADPEIFQTIAQEYKVWDKKAIEKAVEQEEKKAKKN